MLERFKLLKVAEKQFFNYYEKENDFRRLAILYSIGAFIVSPIFCLFSYNSDLLKVYFNICLSLHSVRSRLITVNSVNNIVRCGEVYEEDNLLALL